jgi:GntR family transcriptional regulator/MocR family aminotransferase
MVVMLEIPLERGSKTPLYQQIAFHLKRMIESGTLPEGYKLPGTRQLAEDLSVSRTTVNEAMHLLEAEGYVELKKKSGCYVRRKNVAGVSREKAMCSEKVIWDLASGLPDKSLIATRFLSKMLKDLSLNVGKDLILPAPLAGVPELRRALVKHAALRGIPARSDEVLVTAGGLEALAILIAAIKEQGVKNIFVEELTYSPVVELATKNKMQVCCISLNDPAYSLKDASKGDVLYLIPSFHNPTGRTLSLETRSSILEIAKRKSLLIIEDDTYGELRYGKESVPALKAMENAEKIAYLGSFSQVLFPGFRMSYLLLPENLMKSCLDIKRIFYGSVSSLVQYFVLTFLEEGGLYETLEFVRNQISMRMRSLCEGFRKMLPHALFEMPLGGIYLWLNLPNLKGSKAALKAAAQGVSVVPGVAFSVKGEDVEAVRLSVSSLRLSDISFVLSILCSSWNDELLPQH